MAKIQEQIVVIRLSKLVKDSEISESGLMDSGLTESLESVVQELVGHDVLVEVASE
jgi:hypothetical protein